MAEIQKHVARFRVVLLFLAALFLFMCHSALAVTQPRGESASFAYFFAHRALPQTLYNDQKLALLLALSDKGQEYLDRMWEHYHKAYSPDEPGPVPEGPVLVSAGVIGDNTAMSLIALPEPKQSPEAYYCCLIVTYTVDKTANKVLPSALSYYTLEKGLALDFAQNPKQKQTSSGKKTELTVLGGWTKDGVHHNYGEGPAPDDSSLFLEAVFQLYSANAGKEEP